MKGLTEEEKVRIKAELDMWTEMAEAEGLIPMFTHYKRENKQDMGLYFRSEDEFYEQDSVLEVDLLYGHQYAATTCVLLDKDLHVVTRGACVVSEEDMPYKVDGRRRSLREAMIAYKTGVDDMHRLSRNGAQNINTPIYRSELFPKLTTVEMMRLNGRRVRRYLYDHRPQGLEKSA